MIIDVTTDKGVAWMRYNSDIAPRVGETITALKPDEVEFVVLKVDHLIRQDPLSDEMRQQLVTVIVRAE